MRRRSEECHRVATASPGKRTDLKTQAKAPSSWRGGSTGGILVVLSNPGSRFLLSVQSQRQDRDSV